MRRLLVLSVLVAAGCGGGGGEKAATPTPSPSAEASPGAGGGGGGGGVAQAERVITGWSDALRRSDVEKATGFFTVPLVVSQGQTARLTTRSQVRIFNTGLPCGSKVTGVEREEDYFVASFVLTERPGQRCDGPGNSARVAFKLSGGKIREWRQLIEAAPETEAT